ncbi:hypothetical protein P9314_26500 [Paenibacillus validus]|nr:hypothetical protein [Paenibacillus validus]MED4604182.1 hypothetical protein [Paenibacillus validus]MED4609726.1 hypothetical protein [Paenibacillus validus]
MDWSLLQGDMEERVRTIKETDGHAYDLADLRSKRTDIPSRKS